MNVQRQNAAQRKEESMDTARSLEVTGAIASLIARQSPYIDYTVRDLKNAQSACDEAQRAAYRAAGLLHDDFELFYVLKRFCDETKLWQAADEGYMQRLFGEARRYTPEDFANDPYISAVRAPHAKIGNFTLTEMTYERGEMFQYDMPDLSADIVVPKLGFCTGRVRFPAIYEGNMPWMSVCPSEICSMRKPIRQAHGHVLVLGLGLGYYPFAIAQKEDVESIVIIERQQEIIDLFTAHLLPQFPNKEKISIVHADAYDYLDRVEDYLFDFCFADIWEGQQDGAEHYLRIREYEKRLPSTTFTYWIEEAIRWYILQQFG